jgi:hypothetical protein
MFVRTKGVDMTTTSTERQTQQFAGIQLSPISGPPPFTRPTGGPS